jgi:hypothetical protein
MNEARCVDENLPNVNKTKHPTTKGEKKGTRWMDPSSCQKKKSPTGAYHKGNMNKSRTQTSLHKEHITDEGGRCYNIYPIRTLANNNNTF